MNKEFEVNTKGLLTKYNGTSSDVIIPTEVDGITVKSIKFELFMGKGLDSVIIPEGIESIGKNAFSGNKLKQIVFPQSLTRINDGAFWDNEINEVTIPENIKEIGNYAFRGNDLTKINLPNSKIKVGQFAFVFTENDFELEFFPNSEKGSLCKYLGQQDCYNGLKQAPKEIPAKVKGITVTSIGARFMVMCKLTSIVVPDTVETIDLFAFQENHLTEVVIPKSVKHIFGYAFRMNPLTKIIIHDKVKVDDEAFVNGFAIFYNNNNRKGGSYIYNERQNAWIYDVAR